MTFAGKCQIAMLHFRRIRGVWGGRGVGSELRKFSGVGLEKDEGGGRKNDWHMRCEI